MTKASTLAYTCLIGFDYAPTKGTARRFEPGDHVTGLPLAVSKRLVEADPPVLEHTPANVDAKDAA
jgi:hypothetical protein